jgi:hypothetical protein
MRVTADLCIYTNDRIIVETSTTADEQDEDRATDTEE